MGKEFIDLYYCLQQNYSTCFCYNRHKNLFIPLYSPYQPYSLPRFNRKSKAIYPAVKTNTLFQSAEKFQLLMNQAHLLINKVKTSPKFARDLMEAAQSSNKKRVEELIRSTGITINVQTNFNPDGIKISLSNAEKDVGCCTLNMVLKW